MDSVTVQEGNDENDSPSGRGALRGPARVAGRRPDRHRPGQGRAYAAWDAAFNKGDARAVAAFYTADATFLPATHDVIEGPAGVEKFFAGLFANGVTGHKLEMIEATGGGPLVVGAAKWSANGKDASGAPSSFGGVATHVFETQPDGSLKLKLHTFN